MIYLHGNPDEPKSWYIGTGKHGKSVLFGPFNTTREARLWVIKEIRLRVKELNAIKHEWMHPKDKSNG